MRALYLHGFASSARSKKAAYFRDRLAARGIPLHCPDLNEPDFSTLTMTRMLARVAREVAADEEPLVLIGSSLGAVVAIHAAARSPGRIRRLVLLAPALAFADEGRRRLGAERFEQWRSSGSLELFHDGYGAMRRLHYGFYEDSLQYDPLRTELEQPVAVFQGRQDASVDWRVVEAYAAGRPNVHLTMLDDDHRLLASLPGIADEAVAFMEQRT